MGRHAGAALGLAPVDAQGQLGAVALTREVDDDVDGQRFVAGLDEREHQLVGQLVDDAPPRDRRAGHEDRAIDPHLVLRAVGVERKLHASPAALDRQPPATARLLDAVLEALAVDRQRRGAGGEAIGGIVIDRLARLAEYKPYSPRAPA
ncbi:hypothetical protein HC891_10660, partial [Candidatus Gracilibacteria bacterium]|nr:hypothetical protein [Candidatus Gracilibacteria bacterium]